MEPRIIIIGAGAYGLCVGSYLQMNGFRTEIFEMHDQPGGVCTAWKRKGYTFDGCLHWLMGSGPGTNLHEMWKELHVVQGRRFVEWDVYTRMRTRSGETFTVYTDPRKLEAEMPRLGPDDVVLVRSFCRAIEKLSRMDIPVTTEKMGLFERAGQLLSMAALGPSLMKWSSMNMTTFCSRIRSPALAEAMGMLYGAKDDMPDFPVSGAIMMLGFMHKRVNGYPIGGSLEFARALEKRYVELGGSVRYGTRVKKIIVEGSHAVGAQTDEGEQRADIVISCADGHATLFDMLDGRWTSPALRTAYETYRVFPSLLYVGIGINRDLRAEPSSQGFALPQPLVLEDGGLKLSSLGVRLFHFDPTSAPAGKTAAVVSISTRNHAWWTRLRNEDPSRYREEKKHVGDLVVDALDSEIGDIRPHVEVVDVATPATWIRYTGNWQGSYEGFLPTRSTMMKHLGFTLPGLENFYMHSQWVSLGGGLPPAGMDGRKLARLICRRYGRTFRAAA